jgi:hypothetical protein
MTTEGKVMVVEPFLEEAAPDIDPQDALAAMRDIRRSMVKVCGQLRTLLQEPGPSDQLDEMTATMVAYSGQLQFLWRRYCDGIGSG